MTAAPRVTPPPLPPTPFFLWGVRAKRQRRWRQGRPGVVCVACGSVAGGPYNALHKGTPRFIMPVRMMEILSSSAEKVTITLPFHSTKVARHVNTQNINHSPKSFSQVFASFYFTCLP